MFKLLTVKSTPRLCSQSTLGYIKTFRKTKAWLLSILTLVITFKMFDKIWREDTAVSVRDAERIRGARGKLIKPIILPNGHFAERTFCRTDNLTNGQLVENRDIF